MKKARPLTIALIMVLVMPVIVLASPPTIPLFVYGDVTIDGQSAPVETEISAEIEGAGITITIKTAKEGKYFIEIPDGKSNTGKTILFRVNGIAVADENYKVADVNITPSVEFDLAVTTPPSEEISIPPVGDGGGGGSYTSSITSSSTTQGDINEDDRVDKYDFALLMVNWGKTGYNEADLNEDNKVDKYDFALLMVNWGI